MHRVRSPVEIETRCNVKANRVNPQQKTAASKEGYELHGLLKRPNELQKVTKNIPRGLKSHSFYCPYGTSEAVPFQNLAYFQQPAKPCPFKTLLFPAACSARTLQRFQRDWPDCIFFFHLTMPPNSTTIPIGHKGARAT
jgi:hypothetical protein